jgi:broad specificity phosphatase PhoE
MVEGIRARAWHLSQAVRASARTLAQDLDYGTARVVFCSAEPKAVETAEIVAAVAGLPVVIDDRLCEHRRGVVTATIDDESFKKRVEQVLRDPASDSYGEETGEQALSRFTAAITDLSDREAEHDVVVVSHGTVIALFSEQDVEKRIALWSGLRMPDSLMRIAPSLATGVTQPPLADR